MSWEKKVEIIASKAIEIISQIAFLLLLYFSFIWLKNSLSDINCQTKRREINENTTLKAIAFPHSGGKNQGDLANNGRNKIIKKPVKYSLFE